MLQSDPMDQLPCLNYSLDDELINYYYGIAIDDFMNQFDYSCSPSLITSSNDSSLETSQIDFDYHHLPASVENLPLLVNDEVSSSFDLEDLRDLFETDVVSAAGGLILPTEKMEIDNYEIGARHLGKAFAEAMGNGERELAEVIVRRITDKVSPIGGVRERLLYHSFHPLDPKQAENNNNYLKEEASKVFAEAFEAICWMIPNGMFAHFRANMAILEALRYDNNNAVVLHVLDFDMGNGLQWPSMIVAIAHQQNLLQKYGGFSQQMTLKIKAIKWEDEDDDDDHHESSKWRFEETKNRLHDCAYSYGLKLKVEEIELRNLASEVNKMKQNSGEREWVAFNCMHALPHMGRRRSKRHVMQFLNVAKDFVAHCGDKETSNNNNRGVITYGDGENWEKLRNCSGFGSFFDGFMDHYQVLLESIECNLPKGLAKARIAMECLFVAPFVDSLALLEEWKDIKEAGDLEMGFGLLSLRGLRFSHESLMEAKVMVREGESLYRVRIEGENENEMVLEWSGTPLVRISAWT